MANKISVISLDDDFNKFEGKIKRDALKILKILNKTGVSTEIYLAGSSKMKFLNKKFRGKNKPANVLSFEEPRNFIYPHTKRGLVLSAQKHRLSSFGVGVYPKKFRPIGEIYVKLPVTDYPAGQLLVHGLLHLLGYDHQKKSDRMKMEKLEKSAINKLNG